MIDSDMSLGGTNGPNEQEGAMPSFALPPVQGSEDQEEKPCQVQIGKITSKDYITWKQKKYKSQQAGKCQAQENQFI